MDRQDAEVGELQTESIDALVNHLALDGYVFTAGKLYPID